jgi:hypothetical protein
LMVMSLTIDAYQPNVPRIGIGFALKNRRSSLQFSPCFLGHNYDN